MGNSKSKKKEEPKEAKGWTMVLGLKTYGEAMIRNTYGSAILKALKGRRFFIPCDEMNMGDVLPEAVKTIVFPDEAKVYFYTAESDGLPVWKDSTGRSIYGTQDFTQVLKLCDELKKLHPENKKYYEDAFNRVDKFEQQFEGSGLKDDGEMWALMMCH